MEIYYNKKKSNNVMQLKMERLQIIQIVRRDSYLLVTMATSFNLIFLYKIEFFVSMEILKLI